MEKNHHRSFVFDQETYVFLILQLLRSLIPPLMFILHFFSGQCSAGISVSHPDKRSSKQLLANEKCMQCYHIFMYPRLIPFPSVFIFHCVSLSGWCALDTPVSRAHGSEALLSLICEGILMRSVLSETDQTIQ